MKIILELDTSGDLVDIRDELIVAKKLVDYIYIEIEKVTVELRVPEDVAVDSNPLVPIRTMPNIYAGDIQYDPNKYLIKNEYNG
jgi:sensor histidine kinase YesM